MNDPLRHIGLEILRARTELCLTQADLAKEAKVRCNNVGYIEAGSSEGSFLKVARICRVLGISLDKLMKEIDG